jgi:hypothetical protein
MAFLRVILAAAAAAFAAPEAKEGIKIPAISSTKFESRAAAAAASSAYCGAFPISQKVTRGTTYYLAGGTKDKAGLIMRTAVHLPSSKLSRSTITSSRVH